MENLLRGFAILRKYIHPVCGIQALHGGFSFYEGLSSSETENAQKALEQHTVFSVTTYGRWRVSDEDNESLESVGWRLDTLEEIWYYKL